MAAIKDINPAAGPDPETQLKAGMADNANPGLEGGIPEGTQPPEGQVQPDISPKQVADKPAEDLFSKFQAAPAAPPEDLFSKFQAAPGPSIDPSPQAFEDRVNQGKAVVSGWEKELKEWSGKQLFSGDTYHAMAGGLGVLGATGLGVVNSILSGATLPHDVDAGRITSMDELISRSRDLAMLGGVTADIRFGGVKPLVDAGNGQTARLGDDPATGAVKGDLVGEYPPKPADFTNAAASVAKTLPEKITSAAMRDGEHVAMGTNHAEAAQALEDAGHNGFGGERGYTTTQRAFVPEEEAQGIAKAQSQTTAEAPKSEDITMHKPETVQGNIEQNLRDKWQTEGLHPAEVALDAKHDTFLAHDLGAAAGSAPTMPPLVSPMVQPLSPVGKLLQVGRVGLDTLLDIGHDIQKALDPMSVGSRPAQAIATDVANTERRIAWDHARTDKYISDNFPPESRERMWNAIDEQSVAMQRGESTEHQGLATLEPHEQELVAALQEHSKRTWDIARDIGMVKGEGLPSYGPRIMINMLADVESKVPTALGRKISTRTQNMITRKYLTAEETEAAGKNITEGGQLIRDVRTLPLVTARMERAIMWHKAITKIEDIGATTGNNTVWSGPLAEGMDRKDWFTRPEPAFQTWQPMLDRGPDGTPRLEGNMMKIAKNEDGEELYERVPRYIHKDFEGPLDAIIQKPYGTAMSGLMNLKGKTMSLVMYSPVIHNLVEFSRALPAVNGNPIKLVRLYFDGNALKNNAGAMREAIDGGLVPIGKRFFNQDMFATIESPTLTPGRSWTSQIAGFFGDMYSEGAGTAARSGIDRAGDFWHNTLLWDRVADLQAGLYKNFLDEFGAIPGIDRSSAVRASAHFANRFAGSLPVEAMSRGARTVANIGLFSRTFTAGNYALFKDAILGLPGNVAAQVERAVPADVFRTLNTQAKRVAFHAVATDVALKYATGSILASGLAVMASDQDWGGALSEVYHGYVKRFQTAFEKGVEHPLSILAHPFDTVNSLTPMSENEPGKEDRIKLPWRMPDGAAMYATNPAGKIADQYLGSIFHPIDTLHNKLSTFVRPVWDVLANDKGFGRKIFDPEYTDNAARFQSALDVAKIFAEAQAPTGQMASFGRLATGEGDKQLNALQTVGPFFGTNVSQGAPGGEHKAVLYKAQEAEKFRIDQAMPDIKKAVQDGDNIKAREIMTGLGMSNRYQNSIIHYQSNPGRVSSSAERDLMRYGTPEEKERFQAFKAGR
jgi:hypothetical protein